MGIRPVDHPGTFASDIFLSQKFKDYLGTDEKILPLMAALGKSLRDMTNIIKNNKPYRDFECGFMIYGFSFMLTALVITIFLAEELKLNYTSIAFYFSMMMRPFTSQFI
ncbi:hypothetical protein [uncultured Desulfobacter sp.]|uniref:hypothetical protein n=1 Tax=uncultured Desulfobacter sp. TaxID=240139 RepID=UPI002AAB28B5|nr:hypothetical protein [uncultured Desulfobacter sp.]